jgi:hypothetical protein
MRALLMSAYGCLVAVIMVQTTHADQQPATGSQLRPVANRLIFAPASQSANVQTPSASGATQRQNAQQPQPTPEIDELQQRKQQTLEELHDKAARLVLLMRQKKAAQKQAADEREAADRAKAQEAIPLDPVEGDNGSDGRPNASLAIPDQASDATASESGNALGASPGMERESDPATDNSEPGTSEVQNGGTAAPGQNDPERPSADNTALGAGDAGGVVVMSPEEFNASPISGPIDRLALATSLFATKQHAGCLKVLDALDKETLSAESQDWCLYMMACCLRMQGELNEAESGYRTLVNKSETRWLVEASRWWLRHLNDQQKLTQDLMQVNTTLDTWQKEIHALKKSN